jgi:diguanylate cyclase (GGDEF)-like protein
VSGQGNAFPTLIAPSADLLVVRNERAARGKAGSRLFLVYAAASLVPVALLGVVLVNGYEREAFAAGLKQGRAQAAVIQEMAIAPALRGGDLDNGLSAAELERLQSATDLAIYNGSVVRMRVRSFAGQVAFSDDGSTASAIPASHPAFRNASAGQTDVAIVAHPDDSASQVIRVLQPIVAKASGQSAGVLELYLPYRAIAAQTQLQVSRTYWRLAGGLAALYAVLALIAWSTTRALRRHAAQREHESLHDPLTGLPNRKLFRVRAEDATQRGRRGEQGAVVLVDLDHFKEVNDTLGHHAGDEMLNVVAQRLTGALRTDDTVARLGGDEFGLILPCLGDEALVRELLTRVDEALTAEFMIGSVTLTVEASYGVAFYPAHGQDVEALLQHADAAMYQAKRGRLGIVIYEAATRPPSSHRLVLQSELRHALDRDELVLHYQPKIDLATGGVCGVEALVRWVHPRRGLLGPAQFLSVVEESGLIGPFTEWVLERALTDRTVWSAMGTDWPVAVNVSVRNLESPGFPAMVAAMLDQHRVDPRWLHIEVTETAIAADATSVVQSVTALAEQGITIAIDDFGTGYTSLSSLRRLPVSEVKIDRTFVRDLEHDDQDKAIVRSIVELAHGIGSRVTAEGVETTFEAEWLTAAGCDFAQGYLFARPAPWTELVRQSNESPALSAVHQLSSAKGNST